MKLPLLLTDNSKKLSNIFISLPVQMLQIFRVCLFSNSVPRNMCLPNSPNFNPMDLWASGVIEALTNGGPNTTKTALIATIKLAFSIMDKENINMTSFGQFSWWLASNLLNKYKCHMSICIPVHEF